VRKEKPRLLEKKKKRKTLGVAMEKKGEHREGQLSVWVQKGQKIPAKKSKTKIRAKKVVKKKQLHRQNLAKGVFSNLKARR